MFLELKKVYGDVIGDRQFLTDGANGQFDLKGLQDAFDRFMKSDLHIAPSAWTSTASQATSYPAVAAAPSL